ncbi:MAG: KR domain-containing protein, partial [Caldilinea sp.]
MRRLFAELQTSSAPLRGVFHCAGVLDDGILLNQSWERFEGVLRAKVVGGWLLHELAPELDLMVFFSSAAALLGNPGQGSYAAANAFLDGLACLRRQQGL